MSTCMLSWCLKLCCVSCAWHWEWMIFDILLPCILFYWLFPQFPCFLESKYIRGPSHLSQVYLVWFLGSATLLCLFPCLFVTYLGILTVLIFRHNQWRRFLHFMMVVWVWPPRYQIYIFCLHAGIVTRFVGASHYETRWWCKPPSVTKSFDESLGNMIFCFNACMIPAGCKRSD